MKRIELSNEVKGIQKIFWYTSYHYEFRVPLIQDPILNHSLIYHTIGPRNND